MPALNLDSNGWELVFCREIDADTDAWRFRDAAYLEVERLVSREGLRWRDREEFEWWPVVEGRLFYQLEFPAEGREPDMWVSGQDMRRLEARQTEAGVSVMDCYRVGWRDVARAVDERSSIACILPPRVAAERFSAARFVVDRLTLDLR